MGVRPAIVLRVPAASLGHVVGQSNVLAVHVSGLSFLGHLDDGEADRHGPDVDHRAAHRRPEVVVVVAFPGVLPLVDLRPVEMLRVGRDDHAMVPGLQGQEEFVRKGDGLVQPCLGDCEIDEQFLGWLKVFAVPGETTCLEQRFGSAYQRMSIWQRRSRRSLPSRCGPEAIARPLDRVAGTRFRSVLKVRSAFPPLQTDDEFCRTIRADPLSAEHHLQWGQSRTS